MERFLKDIVNFYKNSRGITSVEYALLLSFFGGAIILAAYSLGNSVAGQIAGTADCFPDQQTANGGNGEGTGLGGGMGGGDGSGSRNGRGYNRCK